MAKNPKGLIVDTALQRVADMWTASKMLMLLKPGALDAACLAIAALLHAQERDPLADKAVTPRATLLYAVDALGDHARNAVGSIACAIVNMQDAAVRDPVGVRRELKAALTISGRRPEKKRKVRPSKKKGRPR